MRLVLAAAAVCTCMLGTALADDVDTSPGRLINIPAQGLAPALRLLAKEWNLQIVYVSEEVGARRTRGAVGELDPEQALRQLLEGTDLTFKHIDDETIAIMPAPSAAYGTSTKRASEVIGGPSRSSPAQPVRSDAIPTPAEPPQITIEARRQALEDRVLHFVTTLTARVISHQSLARWYDKICPQVTGLPQAESDFVIGRLSTISQTVGAPLARGKCKPNFIVLFTEADSAKRVNEALLRHARQLGAWSDSRTDVAGLKEFIEDRGPIRVWYETELKDTWGAPLPPGNLRRAIRPLENDHPLGSRIQLDVLQCLIAVLVVVDPKRIEGLSIGAVADYAAVLGLAKINPSADVADTDSVLRLFTAPDQGRTLSQPGMWDMAFLKAVYSTQQAGRTQRQVIVRSMMSDFSVPPQP